MRTRTLWIAACAAALALSGCATTPVDGPGQIAEQPAEQPVASIEQTLAGDEFYLSLAPYQTQTHPCEFHVPTSCVGEMQTAEVQLRVTDTATSEVVRDELAQTEDNGFVGIWLPRNGEFRIEVTADSVSGEQIVRTGDKDTTCITTLQLQT